MPQYLFGVFSEHWKGSVDKLAYEYSRKSNDYYMREITPKSMTPVLDDWFEKQLSRRVSNRHVTKDKVLFLKCVYGNKFSFADANRERDIEHIVPVTRLSENINGGTFVNCIGNLGLLDTPINRGKSKKTLFEYAKEHPGIKLKKLEDDLFVKEKDLEFVENEFGEADYEKFVRERFVRLRDYLLENIFAQ